MAKNFADYLRPKSTAVKRTAGAIQIAVALILLAVCWPLISDAFQLLFDRDPDTLPNTTEGVRETRGVALLIVLPGILIVLFLVQGLRILTTGRVSGERPKRGHAVPGQPAD